MASERQQGPNPPQHPTSSASTPATSSTEPGSFDTFVNAYWRTNDNTLRQAALVQADEQATTIAERGTVSRLTALLKAKKSKPQDSIADFKSAIVWYQAITDATERTDSINIIHRDLRDLRDAQEAVYNNSIKRHGERGRAARVIAHIHSTLGDHQQALTYLGHATEQINQMAEIPTKTNLLRKIEADRTEFQRNMLRAQSVSLSTTTTTTTTMAAPARRAPLHRPPLQRAVSAPPPPTGGMQVPPGPVPALLPYAPSHAVSAPEQGFRPFRPGGSRTLIPQGYQRGQAPQQRTPANWRVVALPAQTALATTTATATAASTTTTTSSAQHLINPDPGVGRGGSPNLR